MDHGGDDVGVVFFFFEQVGCSKDEESTFEIEFESSESEHFIGSHEEFEKGIQVTFWGVDGGFADDGEGVEIGEGLCEDVDAGVVGFELGLEDFTSFYKIVVPTILAESFDDGVELNGGCYHGVLRRKSKRSRVDQHFLHFEGRLFGRW